ncbi:MAG: sulfurtransferase TusA family protein [Thiomicrospira sp.]|nr:sulfurtransferase TusA family protein [Thiomicrospira sp.]
MPVHLLDTSGLKCPMPVIKLQQAMRQLRANEQIEIICTDPGALKDIQSWCKINKHHFISQRSENERLYLRVQHKDDNPDNT